MSFPAAGLKKKTKKTIGVILSFCVCVLFSHAICANVTMSWTNSDPVSYQSYEFHTRTVIGIKVTPGYYDVSKAGNIIAVY